jgi:endonuclease G
MMLNSCNCYFCVFGGKFMKFIRKHSRIIEGGITFFIISFLFALAAWGNGIDDKCKQFIFKSAPVVQADQYLCNTQYAVAYSYLSKTPIYTVEFLIASHIGNLPRTNNFRADVRIPKQYQSLPKDYFKSICYGNRCDKGHMTPDEDFSACAKCVSESFLMSNMVPQNSLNNEGIWKSLETMLRKYVKTHPDGLYIITGPVFVKDPRKAIGKNHVMLPDMLFKIAIDAKTGKSITFLMPNLPETDLSKWVNNINQVEKATGIKFDSSLDKQIVANIGDWK